MDRSSFGPVTLNHAAYLVRRGKLPLALHFFADVFEWVISETRKPQGTWGIARFVHPAGKEDFSVQLTDDLDTPDGETIFPDIHLALNVDDALGAANAIRDWASLRDQRCEIETADSTNTKWFVSLPGIFRFDLELVSRPPCPRCGGDGLVDGLGAKDAGRTGQRVCPVCNGQKVDQSI